MANLISTTRLEAVCSEGERIAEKTLERMIGTILDKYDGKIEDDEDALGKAGMELAQAVKKVASTSFASLQLSVNHLISLCLAQPPKNQDTLQECVLAFNTSAEEPLYRVMHANAIGSKLLDRAQERNEQIKAALDAVASLVECQAQLAKTLEAFAPYISKDFIAPDDEAFIAELQAASQTCRRFQAAAEAAPNMPDAVRDGLYDFSLQLVKAALSRTVEFLKPPLASLMAGAPVLLNRKAWIWTETADKKVCDFLAEVGPGAVLQKMIGKGMHLPEQVKTAFKRLDAVLDFAWCSAWLCPHPRSSLLFV